MNGFGISDINFGMLEGSVAQPIALQGEGTTAMALNFVIETRKLYSGGEKLTRHRVVIFDKTIIEKFKEVIIPGTFVNAKYHLISQTFSMGEGENAKVIEFSKPVINFIEVETT